MPSRPTREDLKSKKSLIYKAAVIIILVLVVYLVWKMYNRLPPAQPFRYPAYSVPTLRIVE
jgi:hypothetical protein